VQPQTPSTQAEPRGEPVQLMQVFVPAQRAGAVLGHSQAQVAVLSTFGAVQLWMHVPVGSPARWQQVVPVGHRGFCFEHLGSAWHTPPSQRKPGQHGVVVPQVRGLRHC